MITQALTALSRGFETGLPIPLGAEWTLLALMVALPGVAALGWALRWRKARPVVQPHSVRSLAATGVGTAEIARRTGLPQDAVVLLLSPAAREQKRNSRLPAMPGVSARRGRAVS